MHFAYLGPAETAEEALEHLYAHRGVIAIDTETIALKGDKNVWVESVNEDGEMVPEKVILDARTCIGVGIAISHEEAYYFPLGRPGWANVPQVDTAPLMRVLEAQPHVTFFNSMFDLDRIDDALGVELEHFDDVAVACQVQGLWNALDQNAGHLLGLAHTIIDDVLPKGKTMLDVPFRATAFKCMKDCIATLLLNNLMELQSWSNKDFVWKDHLGREFDVNRKIYSSYIVDIKLIPILRKMSKRGFALRQDVLKKFELKLSKEIEFYTEHFTSMGYNPGSNDQMSWFFGKEKGKSLPMTESGKHTKLNEEVLFNMKDTEGYMLLSYRKRVKLYGTYIKPFLNKDRAYTHYRLDLATGRLGSWDFNSQNFPPEMRQIFEPDSGIWSWADLHQAEMRVWANQAKDPVMLKAFADGISPHEVTLHYLFPGVPKKTSSGASTTQYVDSKSFNFALLADASPDVLARTTKKPLALVTKLQGEMYELYKVSREHQAYMRTRKQPIFYPDWVQDDYGRRCHIPDDPSATYTHQEKCRLNYPFQATVASYIKRGMIGLDALGYDTPAQVHDEVLQDGEEPFPAWLAELHPDIPMPFEVDKSPVWV